MVGSTGKRPDGHRWTAEEVAAMSEDDYVLNEPAIVLAMQAGQLSRKDPGPNPKSVS
jgi:hypothetical protein